MLATLVFPVLLLSQVIEGRGLESGPAYRDLEDLSELLDAEKRYADKLDKLHEMVKPDKDEDMIKNCSQDPIELGLIIDSSASIRMNQFGLGLNFLADFLNHYIIGPGKNQVRVAAVSFGRNVYVDDGFNLTTYKTKEEVINHVKTMPHRQGTRTDTGDALYYMREVQMKKTRPGVPRIVLVLTDGNSQMWTWTRDQALLTKQANITVFALGVGRSVRRAELMRITAGNPDNVIEVKTYADLGDKVKEKLTTMTCKLVPKPTTKAPPTTTTPLPKTQPCGQRFPSDINFVFSPAAMGLEDTNFVTSVITKVIEHEQLEEGFQYGVVSGDCPNDAGFALNQYKKHQAIQDHLVRYDRNSLPALVHQTATHRFEAANGGRRNATKAAIIFVGNTKMDHFKLRENIDSLLSSGVKVFVSTKGQGVQSSFINSLPREVIVVDDSSSRGQASTLVAHLCPTV